MDPREELYKAMQIAEAVVNKLTESMQMPEFGIGGVPTKVAAKVFGKSEIWVRAGMEEGWLPIGALTKSENRVNVYISPKKLWEYTGYIWKGEK